MATKKGTTPDEPEQTQTDQRRPEQAQNEGPFDAERFGVDATGEPVNAYGRTASQIQRETEREHPATVLAKAREIQAREGRTYTGDPDDE